MVKCYHGCNMKWNFVEQGKSCSSGLTDYEGLTDYDYLL